MEKVEFYEGLDPGFQHRGWGDIFLLAEANSKRMKPKQGMQMCYERLISLL